MNDPRISWLLARPLARLVAALVVAWVVALLPLAAFAAQIAVDGTTCTLPDAIAAANTNTATGGCTAGSGADTLLLTAAIYSLATGPYDHNGLTATPSVTSTIVIRGSVDGAIIERSGAAFYRLFHVGATGNLTLQHVVVRYGNIGRDPDYSPYGGAIYNLGVLTLSDSKLIANTAGGGGGLFNGGTAMLIDSDLSSNTAYYGGGFYNAYGTATLTNSDFISNTAAGSGGGISNGGIVTLTNSDFISNTADYGGGINNSGMVTLTSSDLNSNTAATNGGGIYNSGTATLTNSDFISNTAFDSSGGGLYNGNDGALTLTDSDFISNTAAYDGGGITSYGTVTITNAAFIANHAQHGGGLFNYRTAHLTDVEIRANIAMSSGGGIYAGYPSYANWESELVIVTSRLLDNVAGETGSALEQAGGSTSIEQSCIANNSDTSVNYVSGDVIDARNNWWGAPDGPSGAGPGSGDSVSVSTTVASFLVTAPLGCPPIAVPALAISKSANRSQAHVGDIISYTYRITNTGNITLTTISADDDRLGMVPALAGQLPPVLSTSATLTYVVQLSDLPGPLVNTVTVTGTDPYGTVATDTVSATVSTLPAEGPPQIRLPQIER